MQTVKQYINSDSLPHAYDRLRAAMAPDPSRWYYTGRINDVGEYGESSCACSHPIRYEFIIACQDDSRTLVIGSSCIETNVPALIREGAGRLATQLQDANRQFKSDLARQRRDLKAEEELSELCADFRRLRRWCFSRREEWLQAELPKLEMPKVFYWVKQLPEGKGTPSSDATAIRRVYVRMWLEAAQAISTYYDPPAQAIPTPHQKKLLTQLSRAVTRALQSQRTTYHCGASFAVEHYTSVRNSLPL